MIGVLQSVAMTTPPPPGVSAQQHSEIMGMLDAYEEAHADKSPILKMCNQLLKIFRAVGWSSRQRIPTDQACPSKW